MWGSSIEGFPREQTLQCAITACRITSNREAPGDGYIMNLRGSPRSPELIPGYSGRAAPVSSDGSKLDAKTLNGPLLIAFNSESPDNTPANNNPGSDFKMHASFTYRYDSEGLAYYGLAQVKEKPEIVSKDFSKGRSKYAYWMVSNCSGRRFKFAEELRDNGIDFDGYGACFSQNNHPCPRHMEFQDNQRFKECMNDFGAQYFFYFAFENSECRFYYTEKIWRALETGQVPIAFGGLSKADYEISLPPHSFIHPDDFESTAALAKHLKLLTQNPAEYNKYHAWRGTHEIFKRYEYPGECHLCDTLAVQLRDSERSQTPLPTQSMRDFFYLKQCK